MQVHKDQHGVVISSIHTILLTSGCIRYYHRGRKDMQGRACDKRCKTYPRHSIPMGGQWAPLVAAAAGSGCWEASCRCLCEELLLLWLPPRLNWSARLLRMRSPMNAPVLTVL